MHDGIEKLELIFDTAKLESPVPPTSLDFNRETSSPNLRSYIGFRTNPFHSKLG
jgi:hypothetical protein